jgi:hypothetical protein
MDFYNVLISAKPTSVDIVLIFSEIVPQLNSYIQKIGYLWANEYSYSTMRLNTCLLIFF